MLLASGLAIPISQLKVGDKVQATNVKTGKTRPETVKAVIVEHDRDLYDLTVKVGGKTAVIQTTAHHRFWDQTTRRWTYADQLTAGDLLRTPGRATVSVISGSVPVEAIGWMWDLTVANDHDFYIDVATTAVLVHNCPAGPKSPKEFIEPTNPPQNPPGSDELPPGYNVRVMGPTADYPNGYWRITNELGQYLDPSDMKPPGNVSRALFRAMTHIPLP